MNSNPHYVLSKWAFNRLRETQVSPGCRLGRRTNAISKGQEALWRPRRGSRDGGGQPRGRADMAGGRIPMALFEI